MQISGYKAKWQSNFTKAQIQNYLNTLMITPRGLQ